MQGLAFPRRKGRLALSTSMLVLLLLGLPFANGSCEFPASWAGEWLQQPGKTPVTINATSLGDKTCMEKTSDMYIVYSEECFQCLIIYGRHENVIQYREAFCHSEQASLEEMCMEVRTDEPLATIFRVNSKPIPCPFNGPPFTFSYNRGGGDCSLPVSMAERCTDDSKLLLKYQACPDIDATESSAEELQCLATWNDGRNKYLVGTLRERNALASDETYRCFLYEEKTHHQGKATYLLAHSGEPSCNGLNNINEGSSRITFTKVDKEHSRCKYPSWVTQHHDWHSLDGTKVYHFTNKNATLKVKSSDGYDEAFHEEKIVCHNLEKFEPMDNTQGQKVKLVAHVTSGCDIGYVCMIFHRRDSHVIELQQSEIKANMPDDACSNLNPSKSPYTTLITAKMDSRKCPHLGRYIITDLVPARSLASTSSRQRRNDRFRRQDHKIPRIGKRRTWQDDNEDNECRSTDIHIGCGSPNQSEMIIGNTCEHEQVSYTCHGSWEEQGTWYTIVSQKSSDSSVGLGQTLCFSIPPNTIVDRVTERNGRRKHQEPEMLLTRPTRICQRITNRSDELTYRLSSQGVCEDLTKAAASSASFLSVPKVPFTLPAGLIILWLLLTR